MSKHTPGPWKWADHTTSCEIVGKFPKSKNSFVSVHCWPEDPAYGPSHEEAVANARLIAAAPDLLETIRRLRAMCADFGAHTACEIASAAIFKATGEQT